MMQISSQMTKGGLIPTKQGFTETEKKDKFDLFFENVQKSHLIPTKKSPKKAKSSLYFVLEGIR